MNFTNIHRNLDPLTFETLYSERNSKKYQTSKTFESISTVLLNFLLYLNTSIMIY